MHLDPGSRVFYTGSIPMPLKALAFLLFVVAHISARFANSGEASGSLFSERVAPLLSARCLSCHNDQERKGDFSLASRGALIESGYVVPGRPETSQMLNVVEAAGDERPSMPKNGSPLTADEVASLREWITQGADWPEGIRLAEPEVRDFDWWSLRPLDNSPCVPVIAKGHRGWVRNPIDAFVLVESEARGLSHAPEADRRTLIRRLSFDLVGLPPTIEEVEAFVADPDSLAYERLVDRLLDSPAYGERWARHWLDVVKYADTCGYDKDKLRPNAWPYRDYVIRSLNDDKPYSRFVEEQLAGDVLFPRDPDGILGLGFIAAGPWDFIGHAEVPETKIDGQIARHTDRDEMVSNTMNTFCSATVQCCQCHNHKFDPFTQQHYYNLQSIFAAVDRADRAYSENPAVEIDRARLREKLAAEERRLEQWQFEADRAEGIDGAKLRARIAELTPRTQPSGTLPQYGYHSGIESRPDVEKWVQIDLGRPMPIAEIVLHPCHDDFAGIGAGFGFPQRYQVLTAEQPEDFDSPTAQQMALDASGVDQPSPGLAPVRIASVRRARFVRVVAIRLASRQNDFHFALAEVRVLDAHGQNLAGNAEVTALDSIEAPERWSRRNLTDGIWPSPADPEAAAVLALLKNRLSNLTRSVATPERMAERAILDREIESAQQQLQMLPAETMVYAATTEFASQGTFHPTHGRARLITVLHRGNVQQPGAPALPGTIPVIAGVDPAFHLPEGSPEGERRAALALWITRRDHPLTWRSIVNRIWQHHFGRGLVDSPNDFGRMGQRPTHPELLDWLASDFRDGGMSFKRLHRLIVTSAVYRQSSAFSEQNALADADNRFLWRMSRRRLEAEELRDAMLAASGRLNVTMGGPGYYLFVLERPEHSPHYEYAKFDADDSSSHRRSIYRFVVRSQPDPYLTTLDCADSSQSTPQRNETVTALQALSLLNNDFSLTMSQHFAEAVSSRNGDPANRISQAFQTVTGRAPRDEELQGLVTFEAEHGLPALCRVLFNLNEFVFVD